MCRNCENPGFERLMARYRGARIIQVLRERQRGWPEGKLRDQTIRDRLIQQFLERDYLRPTQPPTAAMGGRAYRRSSDTEHLAVGRKRKDGL